MAKKVRSTAPGDSRTCPHCRQTILQSAAICPICHRSLQFDAVKTRRRPRAPTFIPLHIQGMIHHPDSADPWEYTVVVEVQDNEGKSLSRNVTGVGVLQQGEARQFSVRVEVYVPKGGPELKQTGKRPRPSTP